MGYVCKVCHEWVAADPHKCSGVAIPSLSNMWNLPYVARHELNGYTFPDLADIVGQLDGYVSGLKGNGAWPAVSLDLRMRRAANEPGMVLVLGNPKKLGHQCVCEVLNAGLPGVTYKTIHSQYKGDSKFGFTNLVSAEEFFRKTGAIYINPGDNGWSGDAIADGGVFVNAHSRCATGLMVHEIVHAYGGPAGMFGEGLTDWFTLDLMRTWGKAYDGNPAYAYNVSLVQRLVNLAGKERVARLAFCSESEWAKVKVQKATGKMVLGKPQTITLNYGKVKQVQGAITELALNAQRSTMEAAGYSEERIATSVPLAASADKESAAGLPGRIAEMAALLKDLMPD